MFMQDKFICSGGSIYNVSIMQNWIHVICFKNGRNICLTVAYDRRMFKLHMPATFSMIQFCS